MPTTLEPIAPIGIPHFDMRLSLDSPFWDEHGTLFLPVLGDLFQLFCAANRLQLYQPAGFLPDRNPARTRLYIRAADFDKLDKKSCQLPGQNDLCRGAVVHSFENEIREARRRREAELAPPPKTPWEEFEALRDNWPALTNEQRGAVTLELLGLAWLKLPSATRERILEITGKS